jgi:hypothetical protein
LSSSHPAWSSHLYDCANDLEAALSSDAAKAAPPGLPEDSQVRPLLGKRVRVRLDDNGAEIITGLLLGFGSCGDFEIRDDNGFPHYCWPMLSVEEVL